MEQMPANLFGLLLLKLCSFSLAAFV